ncbi:hypothetical protein [Methanocaldococcus sp.]
MLPLLILAGGTIASLGLQWWGQQQQLQEEKKELQKLREELKRETRKTVKQEVESSTWILVIAITAVAIFLIMRLKK